VPVAAASEALEVDLVLEGGAVEVVVREALQDAPQEGVEPSPPRVPLAAMLEDPRERLVGQVGGERLVEVPRADADADEQLDVLGERGVFDAGHRGVEGGAAAHLVGGVADGLVREVIGRVVGRLLLLGGSRGAAIGAAAFGHCVTVTAEVDEGEAPAPAHASIPWPDWKTVPSDHAAWRHDLRTTRSHYETSLLDGKTSHLDLRTTRSDGKTTRPDSRTTRSDRTTSRPDRTTARSDRTTARSERKTARSDRMTARPERKTTRSRGAMSPRARVLGRLDDFEMGGAGQPTPTSEHATDPERCAAPHRADDRLKGRRRLLLLG